MRHIKKTIIILTVIMLVVSVTSASTCKHHKRSYNLTHFESPIHRYDDITVKLEKGNIIFVNHDEDDSEVKITKMCELYIDGEKIELNDDQTETVKQFHQQVDAIKKEAKNIGFEAAGIGLDGVMVGLKAIGCVFKLLHPDYDTDDLEREVERAARKVEREAEKLERKAENIEDMVDELEDYADEMVINIPELKKLDWF
ncbi:DUF2884 family protein [Candidatus Zixiibacteriota bacterium]